ncbi:MAG: ABC transporter permease [Chitinivibrionales bacterium]|nr:ABC transporter permease [Chitinivibrionales bacterium]
MANMAYFVKETFRGFLQAKLMTFVSILTISITLFFLGCMVVVFLNIQHWFKQTTQKSGFVMYLDEATSADTLLCRRLAEQVRPLPHVKSITLITKEMALQRFTTLYGNQMLEAVDDNPLPASVELVLDQSFISSQNMEELKRKLKDLRGVESIHYSQEWIAVVKRFKKIFLAVTAIIVPILLLALHFMITNTIKLTIYARKELITNMRFVGATDVFIQIPFILEGILQGAVGGGIAIAVLILLKTILSQFSFFWGGWYVPLCVVLCGVVFGWVGSVRAVRRFLV